ncbi:Enoyl-CoA delta isomerase 2 [Pseudolycoriella hygida]|uniref:Enoyl-CoA delta isomerase 2 n=1 Tax=Pseudolycoriella hygida TaxID=35572 RepID=A0A9Q0N1U3_9DIPT|nr:Enoyl-CoA delta isomerase 2 [Pseudolycoriella hygida]
MYMRSALIVMVLCVCVSSIITSPLGADTDNAPFDCQFDDSAVKADTPKEQSYQDIATSLNEAAADESVNLVAITGAGDFYSSGNDLSLKAMGEGDMQELRQRAQKVLKEMISSFIKFPKLLIAVVNGPCIGIAATTAALCDVVYATENKFEWAALEKACDEELIELHKRQDSEEFMNAVINFIKLNDPIKG